MKKTLGLESRDLLADSYRSWEKPPSPLWASVSVSVKWELYLDSLVLSLFGCSFTEEGNLLKGHTFQAKAGELDPDR